ncbi:hypothetical protein RhiJN_25518 [Ceratobasidium sp. AG-Ba]|nr:hypothetical protein RhiJN_25518 [Ceratobasidium sp. AG-Ba]
MTMISDNGPSLINLSINFDYEKRYQDWVDFSSATVVLPMQVLSLKTLELASVCIWVDSEASSLLPPIWSQITILQMPDNPTRNEELILFANLPALQLLVVRLSISSSPLQRLGVSVERNTGFKTLQAQ